MYKIIPLLAIALVLSGCSGSSYSPPSIEKKSDATVEKKTLFDDNIHTVRKISSHYPHGDSNSETTLIVYESGSSGHTKEVLCMFPPDFQLDQGLSTIELNQMKIPPLTRRAREVLDQCHKNYFCTYDNLVNEFPSVADAKNKLREILEDENSHDTAALIYRTSSLSNQEEFLVRNVILAISDDSFTPVPIPELTGIRKVRIGKIAKEYGSGQLGYLCEKVE